MSETLGAAARLHAVAAASRAGAVAAEAWEDWGEGLELDSAGLPRLVATDAPTAAACGWRPRTRPSAQVARLEVELRAAAHLCARAGVPLAELLESLAAVERASIQAAMTRDAALAGPRASRGVLMWLPVGGLVMASCVDLGVLRLLFATALGWALLATAATLWWLADRWMRALTAAAERAGALP